MNNTVYSSKYLYMKTHSILAKEKNDCAVVTLAVAAGISYEDSHRIFKQLGRKNGQGVKHYTIVNAFSVAGKRLARVHISDIIEKYPKSQQHYKTVTTKHPEKFNNVWKDGKTYIMFLRDHIAAIVDGVVHDWSSIKSLRAHYIYEVI